MSTRTTSRIPGAIDGLALRAPGCLRPGRGLKIMKSTNLQFCNICIYIYIYGEGWGFPGMELYVIEMEFENVPFTLVFTMFYGFVSIHRSIESVGCCADKLRVCPRRKTIFQSSFDMDKNPCFIFPIGTMVPVFF